MLMIGGIGLFYFNKSEEERKNQEILSTETAVVKQIKDRYADVKVVEFISEMSGGYNEKTGYWTFAVNITTINGTASPVTIHFSNDKRNELGSLGPIDSDFDKIVLKGKTLEKTKVKYSNGSEGEV